MCAWENEIITLHDDNWKEKSKHFQCEGAFENLGFSTSIK